MHIHVTVLAVALLSSGFAAFAQDEVPVIVGFHVRTDDGAIRRHGGTVRGSNAGLRFVSGRMSPARVAALRREPGVAYVEEDLVADAVAEQVPWGVNRVRASTAWSYGVTGGGDGWYGLVAVLDTGIFRTHPDLAGQIEPNLMADFTGQGLGDVHGHGTHVAGTVTAAGNNDIGVIGVSFGAKAVEVKVLGNNGSGFYSWIANGITWAANNGCWSINMSLGGTGASTTLRNAVQNAAVAWGPPYWGPVICAAAGNNNSGGNFYPAFYEPCIAVAAIDNTNRSNPVEGNDFRASFSNYGAWVDISAPGVSVRSTTKNGSYANWNGTSMATPHVSASVAIVWLFYNESNTFIRTRLLETKGPVVDTVKPTPGCLNIGRATGLEP